jgi:Protein of unknown function (DUF669)
MSVQDFSSFDLAEFDGLYESAEISPDKGPSLVPDGEYTVVVDLVELTRARTSGNKMMVWKFRVSDGDHSGRVIWKRQAITERTIPFIKEDLTKSGLKLERLSELPKHLDELPGRYMRVAKRTQNDNVNVYIRWNGPRTVESDDDLPF